jgi:transglutaminase-like putative cysteine protease
MSRYARLFVTLALGLLTPLTAAAQTPAPEKKNPVPKSRAFLFTYRATVTGLSAGRVARIWVPIPPSNDDQTVRIVSKQLPSDGQMAREPKFGNEILYVEAKAGTAGTISLEMTYQVTRREVRSDRKNPSKEPESLALYLEPNAKVPLDGKPLELIKDKVLPMDQLAAARILYEIVNNHMRYSKEGTGWGQGDAVWACESGYGNCSDFHSLFLSLARSQKIPARFEIGFPLPPQRGSGEVPGYHCWAKFHPQGDGWVPVDISEANKNPRMKDYYFGNLTEDRLTFSTGRDLELVPKQDGPPLNFFVYPYVEVDGKPYAADKVSGKFSYKDLPTHPGTAGSTPAK